MPIKHRTRRNSGSDKGGFLDSSTNASRWSLGLEARFGYLSYKSDEADLAGKNVTTSNVAFGAGATLEWHGFSRFR